MPDTLCRQCGGELEPCDKCPQCRQAVQMICSDCTATTEVQFHSKCVCGEEFCHTIAALA